MDTTRIFLSQTIYMRSVLSAKIKLRDQWRKHSLILHKVSYSHQVLTELIQRLARLKEYFSNYKYKKNILNSFSNDLKEIGWKCWVFSLKLFV